MISRQYARRESQGPNDRVLLVVLLIAAGLIAWALHMPSGSSGPVVSQSMQPFAQTVIVIATDTPTPLRTQTPWVRVVTVTPTGTPSEPYCNSPKAKPGALCHHIAVNVIQPTVIPWCASVRPYEEVTCRSEVDGTESEVQTQ